MQITETRTEGLQRELTVTIPASDLDGAVDTRLKEMSKTIKMPGFRPGKVPVSLLRKQYGQQVLGEVLEKVIGESSGKAVKEREFRPAMQPKIEITKFEPGSDLEYTITVDLVPEIEPADLSTIEVEETVIDVTDTEIDDTIDRIAKQRAERASVGDSRGAQDGDILVMDYTATVDDVEMNELSATDRQAEVGSEEYRSGFKDQLDGVTVGEERDVTVELPENFAVEDAAGKTARFHVTIKDVLAVTKPEINDAFAEELGFESLEKLREDVKSHISADYGSLARQRVKRMLFDKLDAAHQFDSPPGMVEAEYDSIWKTAEEDAKKNDKELTESDKEEYRKIAERRVRLGLLLAEIGRRENVEVSQQELNEAVIRECQRYGEHAPEAFKYYQKNPDALESLRAPLYEDKVVDLVLEKVQRTERRMTMEELLKDLEEVEAKPFADAS